jgi:hypothetical protein
MEDKMTVTDFRLQDHGSIWLLEPCSVAARIWADEHLPDDAQTWGSSIVIEPRYVGSIITAILNEGYSV